MNSLQAGLSATPIVLTVEIGIQQVLGGERPPAPLTRQQADELLDAVAADLAAIVGDGLDAYGLVLPGALYDITELVRPGLPMVETLFELYRGSLPPGQFLPQLMAIGDSAERFPVPNIAPARRPGSGPLLVLPMLFIGERDAIERLQVRLETVLLEKGRAGAATDALVRRHFGLAPENLAYATFNDLCALLKIQLGHAGLDGLWTLLESALYRPDQVELVTLPEGNRFAVGADTVYTPFFTVERWLAQGGTIDGYVDWAKRQRVYDAGLAAHGLKLRRLAPEAPLEELCGGKWEQIGAQYALPEPVLAVSERPVDLSGAAAVWLTEHSHPELGPVAYTVLVQTGDGRVLHLGNEYPLTAAGIRTVLDHWRGRARELNLELHMTRPDRLVLNEDGTDLAPFLEPDGSTAH